MRTAKRVSVDSVSDADSEPRVLNDIHGQGCRCSLESESSLRGIRDEG